MKLAEIDGHKAKPCIGCGYCCQVPCTLAFFKHGNDILRDGCPDLIWNGKRWICKNAKTHEKALSIGAGCCSPLNEYRRRGEPIQPEIKILDKVNFER